jgi:hypothetical protein
MTFARLNNARRRTLELKLCDTLVCYAALAAKSSASSAFNVASVSRYARGVAVKLVTLQSESQNGHNNISAPKLGGLRYEPK